MADSKITALTALTAADPANDMMPIVDVSDTSMAASGTTKRISINNILACSPSATLASATITGDLTVATNKLKVTGGNVGIGTASPNNYTNYTTLTINGTSGGEIDLTDGGTLRGQLFSESTGLTLAAVGGFIKFGAGTGGTEKMRLDSSGNVGIGITPSAWSASFKALQIGNQALWSVAGGNGYLSNNTTFNTSNAYVYRNNGFATEYIQSAVNGVHAWFNAPSGTAGNAITFTQAMTLDASGILMVGTTNSVIWNTTNTGCVVGGNAFQASRSDDVSLLLNRLGSNGKIALFARQGGEVGDISVTTTGTTFNSTSDYRLKEAVAPLSGGLARVNALKPSIYNWKSNGSTGEGFLAHELAEVVPAAVTGEKDAVNEDGSIKAQSIDMSRVVPILVAAIQELTAEVNALKKA